MVAPSNAAGGGDGVGVAASHKKPRRPRGWWTQNFGQSGGNPETAGEGIGRSKVPIDNRDAWKTTVPEMAQQQQQQHQHRQRSVRRERGGAGARYAGEVKHDSSTQRGQHARPRRRVRRGFYESGRAGHLGPARGHVLPESEGVERSIQESKQFTRLVSYFVSIVCTKPVAHVMI